MIVIILITMIVIVNKKKHEELLIPNKHRHLDSGMRPDHALNQTRSPL